MPHPVEYSDAVRVAIRKHLTALKADLDQLEQTSHGLIVHGLGTHLTAAWEQPCAYSVNNLSQSIELFLKK